jgi:NTE family protein
LAVSPYDYSAARELIDRARGSTQQWLEGGGLERAAIPTQIQDHRH